MAATRSPHHLLLLSVSICFCYSLLLISSSAPLATALSFSFHFSTSGDLCDTELRCEHDTRMDSGVIQLTRNEIHDFFSVGRASYARPVPLWDDATREVASFSSNFTFQIRPKSDTNQIQLRNRCNGNGIGNGDGMAFFLSPYPSKLPPNSYGTNLALFNDSSRISATGDDRVVAVEFDTVLGGFDVSNSHVGIDINSIDSKAYTNVTRSMVSDDAIMAAEISYDAGTGVLTARLQMEGEEPYNVKWPVDMATTLPQDVAVGFSAATGSCIELHQVLSWSFSSTLDRAGTSSRRRRLVAVLVSSAVVAFVVLLCAAAVILVRRRRMWQRLDDSDDEEREQAEFERGVGPRRYRYRELATATKDFVDEEKLGRGGFGNVYRGILSDQDRPVAIKMLSTESSAQGRREFESEVKIISRLRHRNLVQLLGWSDSRRGLLLVYELVSEGSLDRHIYSTTLQLTWPQRYKIILGLGSALRYLHTEWDQCVLHGDIKPSNILLDSSRGTKLADFGLARLVEHGAGPRTTQVVMGTLGYIDPEFIRTRRPSAESDVYSFGIVLLEIVSGQRPEMEAEQPADKAIPLLKWIWELHEKGSVIEAVDGRLKGDEQLADGHGCRWQPRRALLVGLWCTHPRPSARPSVEQAMSALQSEDVALPALSRPPPDVSPGSHGYSASSTKVFSDVSWASSGR